MTLPPLPPNSPRSPGQGGPDPYPVTKASATINAHIAFSRQLTEQLIEDIGQLGILRGAELRARLEAVEQSERQGMNITTARERGIAASARWTYDIITLQAKIDGHRAALDHIDRVVGNLKD